MEIIQGMPFDEYAKRPGVNASILKLVHKKSLMHARAYLDGVWKEESAVLDFGKCVHSLALENREDFVIKPATYENEKGEVKPWNGNSKVCQQWLAAHDGLIALDEATAKTVRTMAEVIQRELGSDLEGQKELSLFAEMKGVPVKCRIDLLPDDPSAPIWDLKTCASAEPSKFLRNAIDLGYLIQAAFTIDVAKLCGHSRDAFALLPVESEAPHAPCKLTFNDEPLSLLRVGRATYRAAFQKLLNAQETGHWPGYGSFAAEEFAPVWMKEEIERTA